ncbi:hypothetical protein I553_4424 [Mycobacterium xenopi 4042]|uniref:Uncharacterized protein n=1 Tax=Mycobacterium xenopi 4042 TaxID=1299334 RepID=X8AGL7_MYCXE|nr:hypothetical protein I553_4424 [Mycobacterium xenopi 4042]
MRNPEQQHAHGLTQPFRGDFANTYRGHDVALSSVRRSATSAAWAWSCRLHSHRLQPDHVRNAGNGYV